MNEKECAREKKKDRALRVIMTGKQGGGGGGRQISTRGERGRQAERQADSDRETVIRVLAAKSSESWRVMVA